MLRNLSFLLFTFLLCSNLFAQEETENSNFQKQFSFDATVLTNRFLNFSGANQQSSPYQITYRKYGENTNKRYGLGFRIGVELGDTDPTVQSSIVFRFGKERFKKFGKTLPRNPETKRWRAFYGWDWKTELIIQHIGTVDITNASLGFGPSPFFGLLFQINERLSVSTEMAYDLTLTYSRVSEQNVLRFDSQFIPPIALYLGYDF